MEMSTMSRQLMHFLVLLLKTLRYLIDYVSEKVFSYIYNGKKESLPPIRSELLLLPASVLAEKIRNREIRSIDVVKAYIHRIREVQPIVNAIVDERFAEAIEEANQADELIASGQKTEDELMQDKPFLGVPVTVKEAIAVKGCLFTVGLVARRGVRAETSADVVAFLRKAGAIPIAITITAELCFWWESYSKLYGRSRNPYDTTRTVGGSSGGEGCILGSAGSVIGIGNDIGGSIRIPAFFNGVFGHKPSRGLVSNRGQYPTASPALQTFLQTGPFCRYATDLLPLLTVLAADSMRRVKIHETIDFSKLKIFFMENDGGNPLMSAVNPEITAALHKVLTHFRNTYGVSPEMRPLRHMKDSFEMWANIITSSDMTPITVEMTGRKGNANLLVECLKWVLGVSDHVLPVICSAVLNRLLGIRNPKKLAKFYRMSSELQEQMEEMLGDDGVFLYPTNPDLALYHHQALTKPFNVGYTAVFNLLGLPISQCPLGLSLNGLPTGIQVVGSLNNDRLTIAVAEELEKAFGGWVCPSAMDIRSIN